MALKRITPRLLLDYAPSATLVLASPGRVYGSEPHDVFQHPECKLFTRGYSQLKSLCNSKLPIVTKNFRLYTNTLFKKRNKIYTNHILMACAACLENHQCIKEEILAQRLPHPPTGKVKVNGFLHGHLLYVRRSLFICSH